MDFIGANSYSLQHNNEPLDTIPDLVAYFASYAGDFCLMDHDWYVPRIAVGQLDFPDPANSSGMARVPEGMAAGKQQTRR